MEIFLNVIPILLENQIIDTVDINKSPENNKLYLTKLFIKYEIKYYKALLENYNGNFSNYDAILAPPLVKEY